MGLTIAGRGPSLIMLVTYLKVFLHLGRFLTVAELPQTAIDHISKCFDIEVPDAFDYDRRTLYRHHRAIRQHLGITPRGDKARAIAEAAVATSAETRLDPADLINAAEIRERYELTASLETADRAIRQHLGDLQRGHNGRGHKAVKELIDDRGLDLDDVACRVNFRCAAVRDFAETRFAPKHRYALALHTDEPHPHVHVVMKALSEGGERRNGARLSSAIYVNMGSLLRLRNAGAEKRRD